MHVHHLLTEKRADCGLRQFESALGAATAFLFHFVWMDGAAEVRDDFENTARSAFRPRAGFHECGEEFMRRAPVQNMRRAAELQLTRMVRDIYIAGAAADSVSKNGDLLVGRKSEVQIPVEHMHHDSFVLRTELW